MDKKEEEKVSQETPEAPQIKVTPKKTTPAKTGTTSSAKPKAATKTSTTKKTEPAKDDSTNNTELPPVQPQQQSAPQQAMPPQQFGPAGAPAKRVFKRSTLRSAGTFVMIGWFAVVIAFSIYLITLSHNQAYYNDLKWLIQLDWMTTTPLEQANWIANNLEGTGGEGLILEWSGYKLDNNQYIAAMIVDYYDLASMDGTLDTTNQPTTYWFQLNNAGEVVAITTDDKTSEGYDSMTSVNVNAYWASAFTQTEQVGIQGADAITQLYSIRGWFRGAFGIAMVVLFSLYLRPTTSPATTGMTGMIFLGWIGISLFFGLFNGRFVSILISSLVTLAGALLLYFGSTAEIKLIREAMPQQQPMQQQNPYGQPQGPYQQPMQQQNPYAQPQPQPQAFVDQTKMKHLIQIRKFRIEHKVAEIKKVDKSFIYNEVEIPTKINNIGHLNIILENIQVSEQFVNRKATEYKVAYNDEMLTKEAMKKFNVNEQMYSWTDFIN